MNRLHSKPRSVARRLALPSEGAGRGEGLLHPREVSR